MNRLSKARDFSQGVSVDVLYLKINDTLEYNLPYVQSGCWHCQSNTSKFYLGDNFFTNNPGLTISLTDQLFSCINNILPNSANSNHIRVKRFLGEMRVPPFSA